ncbi:MAG TPA: hypothetical protein VGA99_15140, partial [bacterium]
ETIQRTDDVVFGLSESRLSHKVTQDFLTINKELKELSDQTRRRSEYLSLAFSGLSMLPIPFLSQFFNILGMGSKKISEFIESRDLSSIGFKPNGLSAYIGFLETTIRTDASPKFPDIKSVNEKLDSEYFNDPFWRS